MTLEISAVRERLDWLAGRIVRRLAERAQFPANMPVYTPGAVNIHGHPSKSFFHHALEQKVIYYASLGRYAFPDQVPLLDIPLPDCPVERKVPANEIMQRAIDITAELATFYQSIVGKICEKGADPNTYGEAVDADADAVISMHERIMHGRGVAEAKYQKDPSILEAAFDHDALMQRLRCPEREEQVVLYFKDMLGYENFPFSEDVMEGVVKETAQWLIKETIKVEEMYLQDLARAHGIEP